MKRRGREIGTPAQARARVEEIAQAFAEATGTPRGGLFRGAPSAATHSLPPRCKDADDGR